MAEREPTFFKIVITKNVYDKIAEFKKNWGNIPIVDVSVRVELGGGKVKEVFMSMSEFLEAMDLEKADKEIKPCETCEGTGKVDANCYDKDSHSYVSTGTENCPDCSLTHSGDEMDGE